MKTIRKVVPFLNKYTSLASMFDMLHNDHLMILPYKSWEDRNDIFYMDKYMSKQKLKTLLATCFSVKRETFHHWKVFSKDDGVCIEFDKNKLLEAVNKKESRSKNALIFRSGLVEYKLIKNLKSDSLKDEKIPFTKRMPYKPEGEFRIIAESNNNIINDVAIPIDISIIIRITLSPWMNESLAKSIKRLILSIDGCEKLKIKQSSLISNKE